MVIVPGRMASALFSRAYTVGARSRLLRSGDQLHYGLTQLRNFSAVAAKQQQHKSVRQPPHSDRYLCPGYYIDNTY